jgi:hypothetical protein
LGVFKDLLKEWILWTVVESKRQCAVTKSVHIFRKPSCVDKIGFLKSYLLLFLDHVKAKHQDIDEPRESTRIFGPELDCLVLL